MKELNELVELAKNATSGKWIADSGEGWDAIISQQDMANANFIIGEFIGPDSKANKEFVSAANPETITAIAEAFRALEKEVQNNLEGAFAWQQRAEAAEHALKDANICVEAAKQEIGDLEAELAEEKRISSKLREDRSGLARECNAFEVKLAELEKQADNAIGVVVSSLGASLKVSCYEGQRKPMLGTELFTRPAPAINLADLVPGDVPSCRECGCKSLTWHAAVQKNTAVQDGRLKLNELSGLFYLGCDECSETLAHVSDEEMAAFINSCRTATLRHIEEQSQ